MQGKGLLESDMDVDTFDELNQRLDDFEQKQTQNQASLWFCIFIEQIMIEQIITSTHKQSRLHRKYS